MVFIFFNGILVDVKCCVYVLFDVGLIGFIVGVSLVWVCFFFLLGVVEEEYIELMCEFIGLVVFKFFLEDV